MLKDLILRNGIELDQITKLTFTNNVFDFKIDYESKPGNPQSQYYLVQILNQPINSISDFYLEYDVNGSKIIKTIKELEET